MNNLILTEIKILARVNESFVAYILTLALLINSAGIRNDLHNRPNKLTENRHFLIAKFFKTIDSIWKQDNRIY